MSLPVYQDSELRRLADQITRLERDLNRYRGVTGPTTMQGVTTDRGRVRLGGDPLHDFDAVPKKWVEDAIAAADDELEESIEATGSVGFVIEDVLSTTGTSHTLANTPVNASSVMLWLNGQRLKRVTSGATSLQFSVSGATVTTGYSVTASDTLLASYTRASQGILIPEEVFASTGTSHTLAHTPTASADVMLFLNGQRLKRVASGATALQFSVSGATVTTGYSVTSDDTLTATYIY
jgi:hypothetical protein